MKVAVVVFLLLLVGCVSQKPANTQRILLPPTPTVTLLWDNNYTESNQITLIEMTYSLSEPHWQVVYIGTNTTWTDQRNASQCFYRAGTAVVK